VTANGSQVVINIGQVVIKGLLLQGLIIREVLRVESRSPAEWAFLGDMFIDDGAGSADLVEN